MFKSILDILEMLEPRGAVRGMFGGITAALQSFLFGWNHNFPRNLMDGLICKDGPSILTALAMI